MRIAYLVNEYPKVSHTFIRREIAALERLGVEVVRYTVRAAQTQLPDAADQREALRTHVLLRDAKAMAALALKRAALSPGRFLTSLKATLNANSSGDRSLVHHLAYLVEACTLVERMRTEGCKHVHAHFGTNSATVAWLAHHLGGPPFSFTVHGPEEFDRAAVIALDAKLQDAKFVAAISHFGRSQLLRRMPPASWDKVKIVPCGLERDLLDPVPSATPDVARFVCVGRLSEQKGHLVLLEAARILKQRGRQFELVLVGDGELRTRIEEYLVAWRLTQHIQITGYLGQEGVVAQLEQSRALVLPSFGEGLPVVIMEAMALARPVISTYVAGIPELVSPGENGWLTPASSPVHLADAMCEALDTPVARLIEMGENGRRRVREAHDVDRSARLLRDLFSA